MNTAERLVNHGPDRTRSVARRPPVVAVERLQDHDGSAKLPDCADSAEVPCRNGWPTVVFRLFRSLAATFSCLSLAAGCFETPAPSAALPPSLDPAVAVPAESDQSSKPSTFARFADQFRQRTAEVRAESAISAIQFRDVAVSAALNFTYRNGAAGQRLMVEATGGGAGWGDFDSDGFPDAYFPQGGDSTATVLDSLPSDVLFRNLDGVAFEDVTESSAIVEPRYGQGVAIADFNNDGFDDILVTNVGMNALLENCGDGTFIEITEQSGLVEESWSSSAAWADLNGDGNLDLYVCNYANFDPHHPRLCRNSEGDLAMCHPKEVQPVPDNFYLSNGDGTYRESRRELGLEGPQNRALGVLVADLTGDSLLDIYVANDTTSNFLFVNSETGEKFEEQAGILGCAVNLDGIPQASMGVASGDVDRNGLLDLYVTHYFNEWNTLYLNYGDRGFHDRTAVYNLVRPTMRMLAFGTVMADFDNDSWLDLIVANGHIDDMTSQGADYEMPPQLFYGNGRAFFELGDEAGEYFSRRGIGRGVATADFDRDGRLDVLIVNQNAPAALLHNESPPGRWFGLRLIGRSSPRFPVGARVTLDWEEQQQVAVLSGGGSFASSVEPVIRFGLGKDSDGTGTGKVHLKIRWPSGIEQEIRGVASGQIMTVIEPLRSEETGR